jgi:RNA polymerase sigma-70 factor (ECF subfamily)
MAQYAVGNTDDALDIVQDAMLDFVRRYAHKEATEWAPLFFRVLQSRIIDAHRRQAVRNRFRTWFGRDDEEKETVDPLQTIADPGAVSPAEHLERKALGAALELAVRSLPLRQQQAFLLRSWEGLDVAATAFAMRCSEGSVKTHYFRAVQSLRKKLEEFKP